MNQEYDIKATGVVRRIDDLGRIVLPKELRRTMRIKEGDSLEIYLDENDKIVLKKYSAVKGVSTFLKEFVDSMYASNKKDIVICDNETVVACAGNLKQDLTGLRISKTLEKKIKTRQTEIFDKTNQLEICENIYSDKAVIVKPINVYGDIYGAILVFSDTYITDVEKSLVEFSSMFMSRYLES